MSMYEGSTVDAGNESMQAQYQHCIDCHIPEYGDVESAAEDKLDIAGEAGE